MSVRFLQGDCRAVLPTLADRSVQCVVTSPPYFGLRDYGVDGQIGLEATPAAYVAEMVAVFREIRRVLRDDGTLWLNLGDSYANGGRTSRGHDDKSPVRHMDYRPQDGLKPKDLLGIPWRVALALQEDGWYLRSDIIWAKPNPMPESVQDRPTSSHEHVFLLTKRPSYFYDAEAVREAALYPDGPNAPDKIQSPMGQGFTRRAPLIGPDRKALPSPTSNRHRAGIPGGQSLEAQPGGTRNLRNVWTIATTPFSKAHFATFPPELAERCIKAGTSERGACPTCGAPWARVFGASVATDGRGAGNGFVRPERISVGGPGDETPWVPKTKATTGWQPTCACAPAEPIPCTVLDPFGGAGTVGLVADRLHRNAVLIELNADYVAMSQDRVVNDAPLLVAVL